MSLGGGGITIAGGGSGGGAGATDQDVLKRNLWNKAPSVMIDETLPDWAPQGTSTLTSGTLRVVGQLVVPAGASVSKIGAYASTGATTPANTWFCLIDPADNTVVARTDDAATAAWLSNTFKELPITDGPYVPAGGAAKALWVGVLSVAATPVSLPATTAVGFTNATPKRAFNSNTGLTTPVALGTVATLGANSAPGWAYIA